MTARDNIWQRLHKQKRDVALPGNWQSRQQFADLAGQFVAALTAVHGEPHLVENWDTAVARLESLLQTLQAQRLVLNNEDPLPSLNLPQRWPHLTCHIVGQSEGNLRHFAAEADVGLSGAVAAIAETGSVLVQSGPGQSRVATLFPPVHIVLLPLSRLTPDLFTFTATRQGALPANLTFISGPSKTADIEQTMAIGVHGPKRFIVILYP